MKLVLALPQTFVTLKHLNVSLAILTVKFCTYYRKTQTGGPVCKMRTSPFKSYVHVTVKDALC